VRRTADVEASPWACERLHDRGPRDEAPASLHPEDEAGALELGERLPGRDPTDRVRANQLGLRGQAIERTIDAAPNLIAQQLAELLVQRRRCSGREQRAHPVGPGHINHDLGESNPGATPAPRACLLGDRRRSERFRRLGAPAADAG
jgi:hypothetical protein